MDKGDSSDEHDRFDELVKVDKKFGDNWVGLEGKLMVNKLSFMANNYEKTHKSVSGN